MSEALTVIQTDKGEVKLSPSMVKKFLVNGNGNVTDCEVTMFLALCKFQKLNPFLREAYLIKFGSAPATIVVGKEVFTKRASKLKECEGWEAGVIIQKNDGSLEHRQGTLVLKNEDLVGGWAKVYRKGWQIPMVSEVSLYEYNKGQSSWKTMPATMIRKVALVAALRDTFPEDFQGMYSGEEMPIDVTQLDDNPIKDVEYEVVKSEESYQKISSEQLKRLYAIAKSNKELAKEIMGKYGYESSKDISIHDYDVICEELELAVRNQAEVNIEE